MKRKKKSGICEGVIVASAAALFVTVGAVENFSISIGQGIIAGIVCAAVGALAVLLGNMEG